MQSQIGGRDRGVPYAPCPQGHTASPTVSQQPRPKVRLLVTDESVLTGQVVTTSDPPFTLALALNVTGACRIAVPTPSLPRPRFCRCPQTSAAASHPPAGPAERTPLPPPRHAVCRQGPGEAPEGHEVAAEPEVQSRAEGRPETQRSGASGVTGCQRSGGAGDPESDHLTRKVHSDP